MSSMLSRWLGGASGEAPEPDAPSDVTASAEPTEPGVTEPELPADPVSDPSAP